MTDLEITKLCAEAMGFKANIAADGASVMISHRISQWTEYDPLHDDAQAMALVKKFQLDIIRGKDEHGTDNVLVSSRKSHAYNSNLNRAICECVAKMQEKK